MKPTIAVSLVFLIAVVVAVYAIVRATAQSALVPVQASVSKLVAIEPMHQFGDIDSQAAKLLHYEFKLLNKSDRPIKIVGQRSSCTCTTSALEKSMVGPNETIVVPVDAKCGRQEWGSDCIRMA